MSSQPSISTSEDVLIDIAIHKLAHMIEYAALYILCMYGLQGKSLRINKKHQAIALIVTILYGISDEIHQAFTPTRSPRWYDVIVDSIGALMGFCIVKIYIQIKNKI